MENKYSEESTAFEEKSFENGAPNKKSIEEIYLRKPNGEPPKEKSLGRRIFIYASLAALFLGLVVFGFWVYFEARERTPVQEKPSIALVTDLPPESEASVSEQNENKPQEQEVFKENAPKAEKSLAEIEVAVLNGGVASGSAGRMKSLLESAGYEKARAENAQKSDHLGNVVYYADGFFESAKTLAEAMKEKYPKMEIKEAKTTEEKSAELVIILGLGG